MVAQLSSCPRPPIRTLVGLDWRFNGWGDLYGSYENDKLVARKLCEMQVGSWWMLLGFELSPPVCPCLFAQQVQCWRPCPGCLTECCVHLLLLV